MSEENRAEILADLSNSGQITEGQRKTIFKMATEVALGNKKAMTLLYRELTIQQQLSQPEILERLRSVGIPPAKKSKAKN